MEIWAKECAFEAFFLFFSRGLDTRADFYTMDSPIHIFFSLIVFPISYRLMLQCELIVYDELLHWSKASANRRRPWLSLFFDVAMTSEIHAQSASAYHHTQALPTGTGTKETCGINPASFCLILHPCLVSQLFANGLSPILVCRKLFYYQW